MKKAKFNPKMRHKARRLVIQALYQWHMTALSALEIEQQFQTVHEGERVDWDHFRVLLVHVIETSEAIDALCAPHLEAREVSELDPVERAILRMGIAELQACPEVPLKVVLNEAIDLAHQFGSDTSHTFINAVLDRVAKGLPNPT